MKKTRTNKDNPPLKICLISSMLKQKGNILSIVAIPFHLRLNTMQTSNKDKYEPLEAKRI